MMQLKDGRMIELESETDMLNGLMVKYKTPLKLTHGDIIEYGIIYKVYFNRIERKSIIMISACDADGNKKGFSMTTDHTKVDIALDGETFSDMKLIE